MCCTKYKETLLIFISIGTHLGDVFCFRLDISTSQSAVADCQDKRPYVCETWENGNKIGRILFIISTSLVYLWLQKGISVNAIDEKHAIDHNNDLQSNKGNTIWLVQIMQMCSFISRHLEWRRSNKCTSTNGRYSGRNDAGFSDVGCFWSFFSAVEEISSGRRLARWRDSRGRQQQFRTASNDFIDE